MAPEWGADLSLRYAKNFGRCGGDFRVFTFFSMRNVFWKSVVNIGSQLRLYLNGIREAQRDHRLITNAESTVRPGGVASGGSFGGLIDEVAFHIAEFSDERILNS